jgi:hypothetical protein
VSKSSTVAWAADAPIAKAAIVAKMIGLIFMPFPHCYQNNLASIAIIMVNNDLIIGETSFYRIDRRYERACMAWYPTGSNFPERS